MKKLLCTVVGMMAMASVCFAADWDRPVNVSPVIHFGTSINANSTSNSVKYTTSRYTPVNAPSDGTLIRHYGNFVTYKNSEGKYWEVVGVFNMNPPTTVNVGDYIGYVQFSDIYVIVSDEMGQFVNNRYTPPIIKSNNVCMPITYFNLEGLIK